MLHGLQGSLSIFISSYAANKTIWVCEAAAAVVVRERGRKRERGTGGQVRKAVNVNGLNACTHLPTSLYVTVLGCARVTVSVL